MCLQIQKRPPWKGRDVIKVLGEVPVVLGQQWYASQKEWYLISPSLNRGRSWQTNGFAVSRMFSGGAGWAEIQRCCLCVWASMKNNKTLWGMNQIQSDRDTKAHMLIHSVNFMISLPLFPSLFSNLPIFLCYSLLNWPLYHWLTWLACRYAFWLCRSIEFLDSCQVYGVSQMSCQTPKNRTHSSLFRRILMCVHVYVHICVCADRYVYVCFTPITAWMGQQILFPPSLVSHFYLIFSAFLIPSLPWSALSGALLSARRAVIEEVRQ